eukprot:scaffold16985_cov102-Isochrysis_galbana.AAC.3
MPLHRDAAAVCVIGRRRVLVWGGEGDGAGLAPEGSLEAVAGGSSAWGGFCTPYHPNTAPPGCASGSCSSPTAGAGPRPDARGRERRGASKTGGRSVPRNRSTASQPAAAAGAESGRAMLAEGSWRTLKKRKASVSAAAVFRCTSLYQSVSNNGMTAM